MILKRVIFVVAMLAACILVSVTCRGPGGQYIIPEKKFINVLVDIHLADGMAVENPNLSSATRLDSASLYGSVFEKHGVTRAMFDSTMVFYAGHPDDFQKMYNKVIARLKKMQEELEKQQEQEQQEQEQEKQEQPQDSIKP